MIGSARGRVARGVAVAVMLTVAWAGQPAVAGDGDWPMFNHDPAGSRSNVADPALTRKTARTLHIAWTYHSPGGAVYSTPAVVDGVVYAADALGFVFALDAATGKLRWINHVVDTGLFPLQVTDSPLVNGLDVIVGDQGGAAYAFDRKTGRLHWRVRPNRTAYSALYGSPVEIDARMPDGHVRKLIVFGVSSNEETFTPTKLQPCCKARGSVVALDPWDGKVVWQTYTVSDADAARGVSGATVWATPTFDRGLNAVFAVTGNNFGNRDDAPTNGMSDAIFALDAGTGAIRWVNQRTADDTFTFAFHPSSAHPDFDFGDSPNVMRLPGGRKVVLAGQKSGMLYALDASTGELVSLQQFLPSGGYGGIFADSANDDGTLFVNGNDWPDFGGGELGALLGALVGDPPNSGDVIAVRPDSAGHLQEVWRYSVPQVPMMSGLATSGGVVYVSVGRAGKLVALDARNGAVLASVPIGLSVSGPSVAHGRVFVGFGDLVNIAGINPLRGGVMMLSP